MEFHFKSTVNSKSVKTQTGSCLSVLEGATVTALRLLMRASQGEFPCDYKVKRKLSDMFFFPLSQTKRHTGRSSRPIRAAEILQSKGENRRQIHHDNKNLLRIKFFSFSF